MIINPLTAIDFYKSGHRVQYPEGTTMVYSNFTPRSNKLSNLPDNNDHIVFFGLQYFIKDFLIRAWNEEFFQKPKDSVVSAYKRRMDTALGPDAIPVDHIEALHDLGFLPLEIRALPEGSRIPMRVPCLTIHNTHPDFFWLVNYIESVMSCYLWKACVSATTARWYRRLFDKSAIETVGDAGFCQFQGHDFSFRGMSGPQDAALSGAAHLLSFSGTDTVLAIDFLEQCYGADAEKELIGCSVPATEHSIMCMGSKESEIDTYRRLLTRVYPKGIVSIVSDTWDFWKVVTEHVTTLHQEIMSRDGKLVIRPDSGDPVKIICGDLEAPAESPAFKGAIECLWDVFGGTVSDQGYKVLDPHIALIYGDSITPHRALNIMDGLKRKKFASTNVVLGIGSYTYQYATRDTYGFAVKSTYGEINGEPRIIFKDPVTDNGIKKSAVGLLAVVKNGAGDYELVDHCTEETRKALCIMETVFLDGVLMIDQDLATIRGRLS